MGEKLYIKCTACKGTGNKFHIENRGVISRLHVDCPICEGEGGGLPGWAAEW